MIVDCRMKRPTLRTPNEDEVTFIGERSNHLSSDFADLFLEELSGLPYQKEIEFAIDIVPVSTQASITPYRMALVELKELKLQL